MEEFKEHLPLVQTLFNPGMRERHWEQISDIVGFPLKPDEDMNLSKLVDMNIESFIPKFEGISEAASKEYSLEKAMEKMKQEWEPVSIRIALTCIQTCDERPSYRLVCVCVYNSREMMFAAPFIEKMDGEPIFHKCNRKRCTIISDTNRPYDIGLWRLKRLFTPAFKFRTLVHFWCYTRLPCCCRWSSR